MGESSLVLFSFFAGISPKAPSTTVLTDTNMNHPGLGLVGLRPGNSTDDA